MALRNLWDMANINKSGVGQNVFSGVGRSRVGPGVSPPGGGGRDMPGEDPVWSGEIPGQGPGPGQQEWGPGTQSYLSNWMDYYGGGGGVSQWADYDSWFESQGITNMSDLYNWWEEGQTTWGANQYDSFYDWLTQGAPSGYGEGGQSTPPSDFYNSPYFGESTGGQEGQYGGGAQGGAGDLGTGNVFIGGGMGSSLYGEGMTGQDCATVGPSFNMQGECIACCGEQYAGTGFYGTGEEYVPEEGTIDPNMDTDCASLYSQAGGFDGTQLSFSEFTSLYC
jgi:hypothetical protein